MKLFKFITNPVGETVKTQVLAALSDSEIAKALNKFIKQQVVETLEPLLKALKDEVEK